MTCMASGDRAGSYYVVFNGFVSNVRRFLWSDDKTNHEIWVRIYSCFFFLCAVIINLPCAGPRKTYVR